MYKQQQNKKHKLLKPAKTKSTKTQKITLFLIYISIKFALSSFASYYFCQKNSNNKNLLINTNTMIDGVHIAVIVNASNDCCQWNKDIFWGL